MYDGNTTYIYKKVCFLIFSAEITFKHVYHGEGQYCKFVTDELQYDDREKTCSVTNEDDIEIVSEQLDSIK